MNLIKFIFRVIKYSKSFHWNRLMVVKVVCIKYIKLNACCGFTSLRLLFQRKADFLRCLEGNRQQCSVFGREPPTMFGVWKRTAKKYQFSSCIKSLFRQVTFLKVKVLC
jgi:hypothetical protein